MSDKTASASPKPYNSPALDEIRKKIDELDNRIHDTLMERAELVLKVGEEKRKNNIQIVQPAREARMIRRLLSRHNGSLPQMAVVRIWRELVGAVSLLQTGLKVAIALPDGQTEYWDLARDYFGSCLPFQKTPTALSAIAAVRENKTTFAVVPWPEEEDEQPWWTYLATGTQDEMKIIVGLPYGKDPANPNPDFRALVVSRAGFDSSGDDNSFLLIQCAPSVSRARLVDVAKKAGISAIGLFSKRNSSGAGPTIHLMEVEDFFEKGDQRLDTLLDGLEDNGASVVCIGGYPVPPSYERSIKPAAAVSKKAAS